MQLTWRQEFFHLTSCQPGAPMLSAIMACDHHSNHKSEHFTVFGKEWQVLSAETTAD
jgi:hypothetical protein